ncbi:histidine phosphatase family protein [Amycolatopsis alkalitolerans]|uniref:Histidine phosphatase family protein n=1 Tax=Amycolatopsis alkalitolerans TaxID=2547244 RepID=A0A5C4MAV2_9PSEU|nr:histidine phosphatase family protein [Amycolatopsis alkalitolerans]TNC29151.1 histidine phosphatase family protein [Amycolatopsis alkalitolerans]
MRTRLLLVRHGETEWHAENRYAGTSDVELTESGLRQAEQLADYLSARPERPTALYCSPLSRARRTAEPSAKALDLTIETVDALRETGFGIAEGRLLRELPADLAERFRADPIAGAFPGAEPPDEAAARGAAALRGIAERENGRLVLVVAHNTLLRVTLCRLLGIPVGAYRTVFPRLDNGAITEIWIDGDTTSLRRLNAPVE